MLPPRKLKEHEAIVCPTDIQQLRPLLGLGLAALISHQHTPCLVEYVGSFCKDAATTANYVNI